MSKLKDNTSHLEIIKAWTQVKKPQNRTVVSADWATRYFSKSVFYVRPLTLEEKEDSGYTITDDRPWYGIFDHVDCEYVLVSDQYDDLQAEAKSREVTLLRIC